MLWALLVLLLAACSAPATPPSKAGALPLLLHVRGGEMPQQVLDAFTAATGVPVQTVLYDLPDGGEDRLRNGVELDVTFVSNRAIPPLVDAGLLHPLDLHQIPNFKNIALSFRGLAYDPDNRYSIPFAWGASGIVARADLLRKPITSWADLWEKEYCGRSAIWIVHQRQVIGATLKSLGYSANSEDEAELAAASERLRALRPCVRILTGTEVATYIPALLKGELIIGIGNPHEAYSLRKFNFPFHYYPPQEGMLLWGDSVVVAASSTQPQVAEQFINFLLSPEIGAELANENFYQLANEAARPLIAPELLADPMLYPPLNLLRRAEILLPLSEAGEQRYAAIWQEFIAGPVE